MVSGVRLRCWDVLEPWDGQWFGDLGWGNGNGDLGTGVWKGEGGGAWEFPLIVGVCSAEGVV